METSTCHSGSAMVVNKVPKSDSCGLSGYADRVCCNSVKAERHGRYFRATATCKRFTVFLSFVVISAPSHSKIVVSRLHDSAIRQAQLATLTLIECRWQHPFSKICSSSQATRWLHITRARDAASDQPAPHTLQSARDPFCKPTYRVACLRDAQADPDTSAPQSSSAGWKADAATCAHTIPL